VGEKPGVSIGRSGVKSSFSFSLIYPWCVGGERRGGRGGERERGGEG